MDKEFNATLMEAYTEAHSKMERDMEWEHIFIQTMKNMKDSSRMIKKMGKEFTIIQMEIDMKEHFRMEKKVEEEFSIIRMDDKRNVFT